jgi:hypothetical protein
MGKVIPILKFHTMKYGGEEVRFQAFLTSAAGGSE